MFGIIGALLLGGGFVKSSINQKYYENLHRDKAKKSGAKFYTDSHGNQRDPKTNKIIPEAKLIPKPSTSGKKKIIYKVVDTREMRKVGYDVDYKDLTAIAYFDNFQDAYDFETNKDNPEHIFYETCVISI